MWNVSHQSPSRHLSYDVPSSRITSYASFLSKITDHTTGRRRKKSCVPRPATPGCCEECYARGVQCRSQEVSLGRRRRSQVGNQDLQQRVAELETALLSINQKLASTPKSVESDNNAAKILQQLRPQSLPFTPVSSPEAAPEALLKHAPILSLFDNMILSRRPDENAKDDSHGVVLPDTEAKNESNQKFANIGQKLLSLFPSQQWQDSILRASSSWWSCWQEIYPQILGQGLNVDLVQFIADLRGSDTVQKIAKGLLCLLVIVQEQPHGHNTSDGMMTGLSEAASVIDELVLSDDELAGTIDGIECVLLRAKYELNSGRIRRSWLIHKRGISLAQLAGLHKRSTTPVKDKLQSLRKENLWKALYSSDRFLSLLVGLPYGPAEIHSDIGCDSESYAKGVKVQDTEEHYINRLANIVGHIIDRNQQLPSNNMLPLTFKIEAEFTELAASKTSDWWECRLGPDATAEQIYSQLLPQFEHHQARTLLHLPFMLKATTDRRFEYNKRATVESAREMIVRYRMIRPALGLGSLVCKMIDFLVFTAGMILVLNLLDIYRRGGVLDHSEADKDQESISAITEILQRASVETSGLVATQAAKALEMFSGIKDHFMTGKHAGKHVEECTTKVVIPFFGTVIFGPGISLEEAARSQKFDQTSQPQQLPTPSDQSLDGSSPDAPRGSNALLGPMVSEDTGVNSDFFADVNFDLDQDWTWFWDNIDVPSVEMQGSVN